MELSIAARLCLAIVGTLVITILLVIVQRRTCRECGQFMKKAVAYSPQADQDDTDNQDPRIMVRDTILTCTNQFCDNHTVKVVRTMTFVHVPAAWKGWKFRTK